jgi:hypothetical protein
MSFYLRYGVYMVFTCHFQEVNGDKKEDFGCEIELNEIQIQ